jgi:outer membrane protein assembly factor BamA
VKAQKNYQLHLHGVDSSSASVLENIGYTNLFSNKIQCAEYISTIPQLLKTKGYIAASVDSLRYDSSSATAVIYTGQVYKWVLLRISSIDPKLLDKLNWQAKLFTDKPVDFEVVQDLQEKLITYLENNGYPFAKTYLDSIQMENGNVSAHLLLEKGFSYKLDSIKNAGSAKISSYFLQQYLHLPNGALYNQQKIDQAKKKISELTYVEEEKPAEISFLPTGSSINFFLKPKKTSQVNILIGFLPRQDIVNPAATKLLITGEANVLLKNAFAGGETIGLNWRSIQKNSPRLNLLYNHPFIFKSPVGLDFSFDMFKRDSSFLNINFQLGAQYSLGTNQSGKVFIQRFQTIVSQEGVDTVLLLQTRQLPIVADVGLFNIGVDYEFNNTDYRLNPRKGNELHLITSIGSKKLKKNTRVQNLKDPNDPGFNFNSLYDTVKLNTYQLKFRLSAAKYLPLGNKRTTIKTAINAGFLQSGNIYRNEMFQIGGYKLLRGFNEESEFLSAFGIATAEFRYLVGQNSYFYVLADGGWGRDGVATVKTNYTYFGTGLGMLFETKAGIFNLAWAVGKRNDTNLNLRQSKIHFGFVNYF